MKSRYLWGRDLPPPSREEDFVLWTAPQIDSDDEFEAHQYAPSELIIRHGAVAIPIAIWEQWRERFNLPATDTFPRDQ